MFPAARLLFITLPASLYSKQREGEFDGRITIQSMSGNGYIGSDGKLVPGRTVFNYVQKDGLNSFYGSKGPLAENSDGVLTTEKEAIAQGKECTTDEYNRDEDVEPERSEETTPGRQFSFRPISGGGNGFAMVLISDRSGKCWMADKGSVVLEECPGPMTEGEKFKFEIETLPTQKDEDKMKAYFQNRIKAEKEKEGDGGSEEGGGEGEEEGEEEEEEEGKDLYEVMIPKKQYEELKRASKKIKEGEKAEHPRGVSKRAQARPGSDVPSSYQGSGAGAEPARPSSLGQVPGSQPMGGQVPNPPGGQGPNQQMNLPAGSQGGTAGATAGQVSGPPPSISPVGQSVNLPATQSLNPPPNLPTAQPPPNLPTTQPPNPLNAPAGGQVAPVQQPPNPPAPVAAPPSEPPTKKEEPDKENRIIINIREGKEGKEGKEGNGNGNGKKNGKKKGSLLGDLVKATPQGALMSGLGLF
jgi:hypothetical protein